MYKSGNRLVETGRWLQVFVLEFIQSVRNRLDGLSADLLADAS